MSQVGTRSIKMKCAICDQYNASIYNDNTDDVYCVDCYEKHEKEINEVEIEYGKE